MKLAKVRFESDAVCARALKELASRMRITVLADETFIVDVEDAPQNSEFFATFK